jgi:hypothetical protein
MTMTQKLILIAGAVIIVALAAALFLTGPSHERTLSGSEGELESVEDAEENDNEASVQEGVALITAAFAGNDVLRCAFAHDDGYYDGVVYVAEGVLAVEVTIPENEAGVTHALVSDSGVHVWVAGQTEGFVFDVPAEVLADPQSAPETFSEYIPDAAQATIECRQWVVDPAVVSVPAEVTFHAMPAMFAW